MVLFHCMVRFGTVHFWGVFHWVLYLVPGTFLVPPRPRFQAIRTVTKTWRVNSTDHWIGRRESSLLRHWTCDMRPNIYLLDLNQHSQRRNGRKFCFNKRTFLHQPQMICFIVCWGSTDVPLVDSRGADPVRAWWRDAKKKALCIYFWTCYIFRVCLLFIFLPLYLCFA